MFFVLKRNPVKDVTQQEQGEIDGTCGVGEGDAPQGKTNTQRVVLLSLVCGSEKDQDANHHAQLTGNTRVSRIKRLGKQPNPKSHGQHGLCASTVTVKRPHQSKEECKQGPMAELKHGRTRIQSQRARQPSRR